jgi:hypothetical protein
MEKVLPLSPIKLALYLCGRRVPDGMSLNSTIRANLKVSSRAAGSSLLIGSVGEPAKATNWRGGLPPLWIGRETG